MHKSVIAEKRVSDTGLTKEELQRYSRHLIMPEVTAEGQRRLKAARVLCIGAGGLGSPAALYLAATGVGKLGLVDFDRVDLTNLQRQILHGTKDIGRSKLESARDRLADINPGIKIELHECRLSSENAAPIVADYDLKAKRPYSRRSWAGLVIVVCFRNRLRRTQSRTVRKLECLAFCQALSGCCKRLKQSS
jgi:adenylyltransferase/sulfurtransferase